MLHMSKNIFKITTTECSKNFTRSENLSKLMVLNLLCIKNLICTLNFKKDIFK
jgi:hypothetical protein